ncbi:MAG: HD domain-containing protein [Chloroflexi bacterium]|nr:HD domain-containing protein [Chloroflexota bacterium]
MAIGEAAVLAELEGLVRSTYQLWDEVWVGFSWRNYTFDHVQRVRALARALARREGADDRVVEFAGLLHDLTKPYDGEIVVRDGKRVLDESGFWRNELVAPSRHNRVTRLYDQLGLAGTVHHVSGGQIATALLAENGFDEDFCAAVRECIEAHLKMGPESSPAGRCLYDADTIDANIGLPAFYRNIQITMNRMEKDYSRRGEALNAYLAENLETFLNPYLRERIPSWNAGKRDDFIPKLATAAGREVAAERVDQLDRVVRACRPSSTATLSTSRTDGSPSCATCLPTATTRASPPTSSIWQASG